MKMTTAEKLGHDIIDIMNDVETKFGYIPGLKPMLDKLVVKNEKLLELQIPERDDDE